MATTPVSCSYCGTITSKDNKEINRARKRNRELFCSRSCAAQSGNTLRRAKEVVMVCVGCGTTFVTTTHNKAKRHCSRSCASRASMSEERRAAQQAVGLEHADNLLSALATLKRREAWKYVALRDNLKEHGREFEFEFALGDFVFDLALLDVSVLVEFDGPYHKGEAQLARDRDKDECARAHGFVVVRRGVVAASVIDPITIDNL